MSWHLNPRVRDWTGRRVWLVGASTGIGAALARQLAERGARVALTARREAPLQALAQSLAGACAVPCDVAVPGALEQALATVRDQLGGLDVVIYNAGVWYPAKAESVSAEAIDATLDVNLRAPMHLARLVTPHFLTQGQGDLAFVASVAGYRPLPLGLLYGSSKAALIHFAGALHLDLAPQGIGVRLINPGFVDTPMTATNHFHMPAMISSEAAAQEILAGYAAGEFEIHFPKRFTCVLKCLSLLPDALYLRLARRLAA